MKTTVSFPFKILKERFGLVAPDVQIEDGKGTILISSEEGETEGETKLILRLSYDNQCHCICFKVDSWLVTDGILVCGHRKQQL